MNSNKYVKKTVDVPFADIYLDPNNPRIAPEEPPGYDNPKAIIDPEVQSQLEVTVQQVYQVDDLMGAILTEGWLPLDPIIVWELPSAKGKYVVLEGNTRTTVLQKLRNRLEAERNKLEKAEKAKRGHTLESLQALRDLITHLEKIKKDTTYIHALEVNAKTPEELEEILPHLHSVRHINHAKQWSPYATNLYMLEEYRKLHRRKFPGKPLTTLDDDLVKEVAAMMSLSAIKTRRNLQSASAFSNFKLRFMDQLPTAEDKFTDRDQYFFEHIAQSPFLRDQFGLGMNDLQLDPEKEASLFKLAFSKTRKGSGPNPNVLRIADDLKLWSKIKEYDDDHGTGFHRRLNLEKPEESVPMLKIEADYLNHQTQARPIDAVTDMLEAIKKLKGEDLIANGTTLTPMLQELIRVCNQYLRMIKAAEET